MIGAGCGGTTAAALLAKHGYDVLLLEQSSLIGGCCSTAKIKGYNFDFGASIIEDADVIDQVFGRLGSSLAKEVKLVPCEPVYDCMLSDGSRIEIPTDIEATVAELAKVSPADAQRFRKYVKNSASLPRPRSRVSSSCPRGASSTWRRSSCARRAF